VSPVTLPTPATRARPLPELPGVTHRFVELGDMRMHVAEAGAGDPVVLIHGFYQHWWEWRKLIPGLAEHYRVICPDLRGFGWSDAPPAAMRKEDLAADIAGLLDALELDRVRLIAHDWGGMVGFLLCLRHEERVSRYLALNTGHPFVPVSLRPMASLWRFWYQLVLASPVLGRRLMSSDHQRFMRFLYRWVAANPGVWSDEDAELYLAPLREPDRARAGVALFRSFLLRELPLGLLGEYRSMRLRTPTLFLHGTSDPVIRPALLHGYERNADDMRVELVEGVGHYIAEERPQVVLDRALRFFAD
jgi:pimeloyl-ACP methyl ester carboxylesterase